MLKVFYPKLYTDSIYDIPYKKLLGKGIKGLVFDVDNTLAPYDVVKPDKTLIKFFNSLKQMGFKICLVSNNSEKRIDVFNSVLMFDAVPKAGKPRLGGIKKALGLIDCTPAQAAFIGDQVFTDIWCGNRMKIYTILVKPMSDRDEFTVRLKRGIEKIVINSYIKRS